MLLIIKVKILTGYIYIYNYCAAGNDFMFMPVVLVFSHTVYRRCVYVTILDDNQREREEQFSLNLTLLHMNESSVRLNTSKSIVTIIDDDCK